MAYVSKEKKQKIAAALKTVMPKGWRWSLAINHGSTLILTIASAPVDLMAEAMRRPRRQDDEARDAHPGQLLA